MIDLCKANQEMKGENTLQIFPLSAMKEVHHYSGSHEH